MPLADQTMLDRARAGATPLVALGALGLFGGLMAEQPVVLLVGVAVFVLGLVLRTVKGRDALLRLPAERAQLIKQHDERRVQWMYVVVLIGFVSFLVRYLAR